jgi:hypothetical protein
MTYGWRRTRFLFAIIVLFAGVQAHAQDITTKNGVVDALNLMWQRAEVTTHATANGSEIVIHSEKCSQERFAQLSQDASMLKMARRAGFSTLTYTNDKGLTFTLTLPSVQPTDADRQQYAKNLEANLGATHPELMEKVTVDGARLVLHTPFASKADFYKADWTKAEQLWIGLGFTEFLYTNDKDVAIILPLKAAPEAAQPLASPPEFAKEAEPFGFHKGMTKDQITSVVGTQNIKEQKGDLLVATTAPKPNPIFEEYLLTVSPTQGLLKVMAVGQDIQAGDTGAEVRSAFDDVVQGASQKYGKPTKIFDFCNGGTGCDSDSYWMLSLLGKNRTLMAYWQLDYVTVMVEARAAKPAICSETTKLRSFPMCWIGN